MEKLTEDFYLTTPDDIQGLIAQSRTIEKN